MWRSVFPFDPSKFLNLPEPPDRSEWQFQTLDTRVRDLNQYGIERGPHELRESSRWFQIGRALDSQIDPEPDR